MEGLSPVRLFVGAGRDGESAGCQGGERSLVALLSAGLLVSGGGGQVAVALLGQLGPAGQLRVLALGVGAGVGQLVLQPSAESGTAAVISFTTRPDPERRHRHHRNRPGRLERTSQPAAAVWRQRWVMALVVQLRIVSGCQGSATAAWR